MNNDITKLLHIEDSGVSVLQIRDKDDIRTIVIERPVTLHYCTLCGCRMYSKGVTKRHVKHSMTQDGCKIFLEILQRRWQCKNPDCKHIETDQFSFVEPRRRTTNLTDILIVKAFKDHTLTASKIARTFNVSPEQALVTFSRYVDMPRRQLSSIISIDEVFLGIKKDHKYVLIIHDFITGEPIDMVRSRRQEVTDPYFTAIPYKECQKVQYLITDMYRPYVAYVKKYFPNALATCDSFHVIKMINGKFQTYIRKVIRKIDQQDQERHRKLVNELHREIPFTHSKEYTLLKNYHWMLLKNESNLKVYTTPKYNIRFKKPMTTQDYMEWMFSLDPNFRPMYKMKELYVHFNKKFIGDPDGAKEALPKLIEKYRTCGLPMFDEVAKTLEEFKEPILRSFIIVKKHCSKGDIESRLSNGPIESLNRTVKDLKRNCRGFANFEHVRNRYLFSQRENAAVLGQPKTLKQVYAEMPKKKKDEPEDDYIITEDDDFDDDDFE